MTTSRWGSAWTKIFEVVYKCQRHCNLCLAKRSSCTNWTGNFQTNPVVTINSASHFGRFLPEILDQFFKNLEKIQFYEEARFSDQVYLAQMSDEPMGGRGSNIFDHDSFFSRSSVRRCMCLANARKRKTSIWATYSKAFVIQTWARVQLNPLL